MRRHPEYDVSVLLRNTPDNFKSLYPKVHIVKGEYDSADILTEAASNADLVVRACQRYDTHARRRYL